MTLIRTIPAAAMLVLAACGSNAAKTDDATPAAPQNEAQRAAAIALALQAAPDKTDSVLSANGVTADQLEQMMYRVARDSTLAAEYSRLTVR